MKEIGLDISAHTPKSMNLFLDQRFDYVLTVCDNAAEVCPVFPGKAERHHRNFTDPASASPDAQGEVFRHVRDAIIAWLTELFAIKTEA